VAWKRGWSWAQKQVVMGDGAEWIWNLVALHFPGAVQIVDLYHARQHLWELARRLYSNDEEKQRVWIKVHPKRLLDKGKIEKLVSVLRALRSSNSQVAAKIRSEADCFQRNAQRMRYPQFPRQHLFVGSGVIEAACKLRSLPASSAREGSGPCAEPTPSSPSAAHCSMATLRITGRTAG
jgi:hypothetical protein